MILRTVRVIVCKSFDGDSVSGACFFIALSLRWLHISKKVPKIKKESFGLSGVKYRFGAERFV